MAENKETLILNKGASFMGALELKEFCTVVPQWRLYRTFFYCVLCA